MKSCPKCGVQLPDEAVFCNNCGANLAADPQPMPTPQAPITPEPVNNATLESAKEKNKNTKVGLIAIIAGAAVFLILLIVFVASLLGGGYKTPIKQLINNMNKHSMDVDSYIECFAPGYVVTAYNDVIAVFNGTDFGDDFADEMNDTFERMYDHLEDEYGDDYRVSFEVKKAEHMDDDDIEDLEEYWTDLYDSLDDMDLTDDDTYEDLQEELEDYYDTDLTDSDIKKLQKAITSFMKDFKNFHIQDAYEVKIKLSIEGDDGDDSDTITLNVIKVNGNWFIDPFSADAYSIGFSFGDLMYYLY